jgi:aminopeptidase YwaD
MKKGILLLLLAFSASAIGQINCIPLKKGGVSRIQKDIGYLASDELEGRKPGTKGAEMAAAYIQKNFKMAGLGFLPGYESYRQNFPVSVNVAVGASTSLFVNGEAQRLNFDFFPTKYSANAEAFGKSIYVAYGIVAPELKRNDYKRKKVSKKGIVVMDIGSPDGVHPHSDYIAYHDLGERIALAKEEGAEAVLLVNVEGQASDLSPKYQQIRNSGIPVLFIQRTELAKQLMEGAEVELIVEQYAKTITAFNVLGMINNNAAHTVIIGAHYDHLGYGGRNSLYANKEEPEIHNGADDNASGTAGLLELARYISSEPSAFNKHNFVFMAFSAEEEGLLGSAYFVKNTDMDLSKVSYMLNMDMIGRLEDSALAISGVGTSPFWKDAVVDACGLKVKTSESGTGPSDHTSFYNRDIPVLHFFTGTHTDYHKPSDDVEKINAEGEAQILSYMLGLISKAEAKKDLAFTQTKADETVVPRFTVTLGVMPDYMFEGEGMKIDGVTEGKPAAAAQMQAGDVVTKLGEVKVVDMMSYMKALGQFKKGDKAKLTYKREDESIEVEVQF